MKILIIAISMFVGGCASIPSNPCSDDGDEFAWYPNPVQIEVTKYEWEVDTTANAKARCAIEGSFNFSCLMGRIAESKTAHIVSSVSHEEAKLLRVGNLSLLEHEIKHGRGCLHSNRATEAVKK